MSAQDDYKIMMNIIAQSPNGISDPNLIGKFSKAKATIHAMDSMAELRNYQQQQQPQQPPVANMPSQPPQQGETAPISSEPTQSVPTEENVQAPQMGG